MNIVLVHYLDIKVCLVSCMVYFYSSILFVVTALLVCTPFVIVSSIQNEKIISAAFRTM
jgi:hypothetical protein